MSHSSNSKILVTGATGLQGGSVVSALLKDGRKVRALVRDANSERAKKLESQGVEIVVGEFDNIQSLDAAMVGVSGVFSVQLASPPNDLDAEVRFGKALIDAAYRAGVETFVQTSVARAGDHEHFVGWDNKNFHPNYWEAKAEVNNAVKAKGFKYYVILKPALIMEDILKPMVDVMFPTLALRGTFETVQLPEIRNDWIAGKDIGSFAAAAFAQPERFNGHEIDLASVSITLNELAQLLTKETGRAVKSISLTKEEALASGMHEWTISGQLWNNFEGYKVDLAKVRRWEIPLTSFEEFIKENRERIVIG